jgi:cytochrome c oxidase assembly protein subunit 11
MNNLFSRASRRLQRLCSLSRKNEARACYPSMQFSSTKNHQRKFPDADNVNAAYAVGAVVAFIFGLSYASVPLYKVFCSMTGFGGTTQKADTVKAQEVKPVSGAKILKIYFTANVHSEMPWTFRPAQHEIKVVPGETALAFYTVKNKNDFPVTGVATYNVHPPKAGLYFNKIQCFCFEEQRLGPYEEIDMPVFFFIDPDFLKDPAMDSVSNITLSYTFFKTGDEDQNSHDKNK